MHHRASAGRQITAEHALAAVRHGARRQVLQLEGVAGRGGVGLGAHVDGVTARRQAAQVKTLEAAQAEAQLVATLATQDKVGGAALRVQQQGVLFGQHEAVVVDISGAGDRPARGVTQRHRGGGLGIGAQHHAARARQRVVVAAVEVQHLAAGFSERDALRRVLIGVIAIAAAGQRGAAGAHQIPILVEVMGAGARVDQQGLALGAVKPERGGPLALALVDGGARAQRQHG